MKKGLLSILAGALVVVGCQNYDDQFDSLESQINALASTVAGLSQVQSDLASLSGTVASLASTVNGLGSQIDTAVANGLADIQADIADIEAAVADVASSEAVDALSEAVAASQEDLDELLANSSIFTGNVIINSQNTLDTFHAMGSTLAIVNGDVDIDVSTSMDIEKVQEVVDQILNVTGDFFYTAGTGVDTEVTFSNLSGTSSLTLDQKGGYMLENLTSATIVVLEDDSTADVVHLGSLTTVTSLSDGSGAGTFEFDKASELHLTSLPRYNASSLSLKVKEGGVIALNVLADVDADGEAKVLDLTIDGPDTFTMSTFSGDKAGSDLTFKNVANATVNGYDGKVTIGEDVLNFTSDGLVDVVVTSAADLVSFTAVGAIDPNDDDDEAGPALTLDSKSDLETVSLSGTYNKAIISSNGNLASVTVAGTVTGADGIQIKSNSDLTAIDVSEATTDKLIVYNNSDLETLTVDFTAAAGEADTQEGTIDIDTNESLTSLTISTDNIDNLSITDNVDLETIDLSDMTAIGAKGSPTVYITGNKLEASVADEENDSFTESAGMSTAKEYLDAVADDADSVGEVHFDTVESVLDADGDEESTDTADFIVWKSGTAAVVEGAYTATVEKRAFIVDISAKDEHLAGLQLKVDGVQVFNNGTAYGSVTMTDNKIIDKGELLTNLATTRATDLGFELDVVFGGNYTLGDVTFLSSISSVSNGEYFSNTAAYNTTSKTSYLTTYDEFTISIGGRSARASIAAGYTTVAERLADALTLAWGKKWASDGASANFSFWTTAVNDGDAVIEAPSLRSPNSGSRAANDEISITWTNRATAAQVSVVTSGARTESVIDWTHADDKKGTSTNDLIIYLTEVTDGVISSGKATLISSVATAIQELTTNLLTNDSAQNTDTTTTIYPTDARGDVVKNEASSEGVETSPEVPAKDRTSWLD